MEYLQSLIDQLIGWGEESFHDHLDNERQIISQLVNLYQFSLQSKAEFTDRTYPEPPEMGLDEEDLRKQIRKNFPSWGYYNQILNPVDHIGRPEFGMGDANEDLTEIIKSLKGLQWRFTHNCPKDSLWHFHFIFENHLALRVINLLRYMEVKKMHKSVKA